MFCEIQLFGKENNNFQSDWNSTIINKPDLSGYALITNLNNYNLINCLNLYLLHILLNLVYVFIVEFQSD